MEALMNTNEVANLLFFKNLSKDYVPIWERVNLTIDEATQYFGIGRNKLLELTNDEDCEFVLFNGTKRLIKRKAFEKFLNTQYSI